MAQLSLLKTLSDLFKHERMSKIDRISIKLFYRKAASFTRDVFIAQVPSVFTITKE